MADTSQKPATGFVQIVDKRDAATLVPIITAHVAPGTIVHSDGWASYSQVPYGTSHGTVNHSVCFVDPTRLDGGTCFKSGTSCMNRRNFITDQCNFLALKVYPPELHPTNLHY
ncbi:hypothetical protein EMCRGX_G029260 [Ephydatia muelleri]